MEKQTTTFFKDTILESITLEEYGIDTGSMSQKEILNEVYNIFLKEYVHHNNERQDRRKLFKEWLQGLPTILTVPFNNHDILLNARGNGIELREQWQEDNFLNMYWMDLSRAFFYLKQNLES